MPTITDCLKQAPLLAAQCKQPLREAQAVLAHCADISLATMYTWPEQPINEQQYAEFCRCMQLRATGYPLAYITGHKEFWSLDLAVEEGVLIPRPETELLVEHCLALAQNDSGSLLDLGTGTGAIALAFASEKPHWAVTAIDANPQAVRLAVQNAQTHGLKNVTVLESNWFSAVAAQGFNVIAANPPYIDASAPELAGDGVSYEPRSALVAADKGMSDLNHIITAAKQHLNSQGYLLLEHGYDQGELCRKALRDEAYAGVKTLLDYAGKERVTLGQYVGS